MYYIEEYSSSIPLFLTENQIGSIHSVFNNGLNIKFGKRLLFIGTTKNGQLPFGAHLSKNVYEHLLKEIDQQYTIHWHHQEKIFTFNHGNIILSLEKAHVFENRIRVSSDIDAMYRNIETILVSLLNFDTTTGLDVSIEQFVIDYLQGKATNVTVVENIFLQLSKLTNALFTDDKEACITALRYVLGRGRGLTPSGDDHVVGMLAVQAACRPFHTTFNEAVLTLVENESITTDVAKEYLYYAAHGQFSSTVLSVVHHLIKNTEALPSKLEDLLAVGHSSGVDTIFGILLGLLAWRRKSICPKK